MLLVCTRMSSVFHSYVLVCHSSIVLPWTLKKQQCEFEPANIVSQNSLLRSGNILNKRGNTIARNRRHLIPITKTFNIKHDYDNVIPVGNTSTHQNLMIDNQHKKPTLAVVYRAKSRRTIKKPKRYIDEMWYDLLLTSGYITNNPKQYYNEMWFDMILTTCMF